MARNAADELLGGDFTPGHVDPAAVRAGGASAASGGHPLLRHTPGVGDRVVLLHHVRVRGGQDERVAGAAADDVDLAVDDAAEGVVARHRHRRPALPLVRGWVIYVVGAQNASRPEEREERVLGPFHRRGAADHVDLAAHFRGDRRTALARQRGQRLPRIGGRVVLPRVVDGFPRTTDGDGGGASEGRSRPSRRSCRSQRPGPHGGPAAASTPSSSTCRWPGCIRRRCPGPCPRQSLRTRRACRWRERRRALRPAPGMVRPSSMATSASEPARS